MTEIIRIEDDPARATNAALSALRRGEVIAFPTETVYGVGMLAQGAEGVQPLRELKGRGEDKPFQLLAGNAKAVENLGLQLSARAEILVRRFWPGALTLVLSDGEGGTVGLRVPDHPWLLEMLRQLDMPLTATSANPAGCPPAKSAREAYEYFEGRLNLVIDGGEAREKQASTVVDVSGGGIVILREGAIVKTEILAAWENSMKTKTIAIGSDHAAYQTKEELESWLIIQGYSVKDFGTDNENSCDYPDIAHKVTRAVASGEIPRGLLLCGTGLGMSYVANRQPGVRASLCWSVEVARLAREHNDANILVLPGRAQTMDALEDILAAWLETPFSGIDRHQRRIEKIDEK
jgi:ribose 5-phosphate isomerase B